MPGHKCFIQPLKFTDEKAEEHRSANFIYFDFETFVAGSGELVPNLAVVQYDDGQEYVFPSDRVIGPDVTEELCRFIFQDKHRGFYVIAHNFQSFDGTFILKWMLKNNVTCDPTLAGGKIKNIYVRDFDMCFRDSLAYVPTSLSKFPAVVGLPNLEKGAFPHHFNRPENWNSTVSFPEKEEFDYRRKSEKEKREFDVWYLTDREEKRGLYDFNKEFIDYCSQVETNC